MPVLVGFEKSGILWTTIATKPPITIYVGSRLNSKLGLLAVENVAFLKVEALVIFEDIVLFVVAWQTSHHNKLTIVVGNASSSMHQFRNVVLV